MRQVVLDTETTGLDWRYGDRVIEIAGVEMVNRRLTGRHYHCYLNPEREIDHRAQAVHGISSDFLADKPKFAEVASAMLEFIQGAELVIHNAPFDVGFLNNELALDGRPGLDSVAGGVLDTLLMAKELHPGKRNNLDALCDRYQISNAHRKLHGALLDAELLAEVYLAMTRGQDSLIINFEDDKVVEQAETASRTARPPLMVLRASADEQTAHDTVLTAIDQQSKGLCRWLQS